MARTVSYTLPPSLEPKWLWLSRMRLLRLGPGGPALRLVLLLALRCGEGCVVVALFWP